MKRHKCTAERQKPVSQQRGAVQCGTRWFHSKGGLAVHRCDAAMITRVWQLLLTPPHGGSRGRKMAARRKEGRKGLYQASMTCTVDIQSSRVGEK